jgi:hypothetical protein
LTVRYTGQVVVRDNVSDVMTAVSFEGSDAIVFRDNVNIVGSMESVEQCPPGIEPRPSGGPDAPDIIPGPDATLVAHTIVRWAYGMMNGYVARQRTAAAADP